MYGGSGYDDGGYGQYGDRGQQGDRGQYGYGGQYGDAGQYGYGGQYGDAGQYGYGDQYGYGPGPGPGPGYGPGPYGPYGPGHYGYGPGPGGYPPPPRRHGLLSHLLVALLAAGVAAGVVLAATPSSFTSSAGPSAGSGNAAPSYPGYPGLMPEGPSGHSVSNGTEQAVINKVRPGIVFVNTNLRYNGEAGAGTGMVINPDGLVLTNNHVIEGSTKITATVVSTGKSYPAKVVGYDKTGDIAVIKLQGAPSLHTVPLGNSSDVKAGTSVVALGNAGGRGSITPATGRVTAVNQEITASDPGGTVTSEKLHGMLETNADIVSGDSGGPLADTAGTVIGMDTAGNSQTVPNQASATGFAIPISRAMSVARQITAGQASSTVTIGYPPFMGIFVAPGNSSNPRVQAEQQNRFSGGFGGFGGPGGPGGFGGQGGGAKCYSSNTNLSLPKKIAPVNSGSLVDGAICGSPAASAGLTGGSVITAVNGQTIGSPKTLTSTLAKFHPGDTVSVTWVSPSGHQTTSSIHLAAGPPQ